MSLYNEGLGHGSARFIGNVIKCALLESGYTFDETHNGFAAITAYETGATVYVAGGSTLANTGTTIDDTNDIQYDTADDVAFGLLDAGNAQYAVIYDETANLLLRYIDFGTSRTFNGGAVTLSFTNNRVRTRQAA